MKTDNLIFKMLKENTGVHICDSGGGNGRMWQRNAAKTKKDFQNEPQCTLDLNNGYFDVTISLYHHLTATLSQDDFCQRFNKLKCADWDGDYYGTSKNQCHWLVKNDFEIDKYRNEFNSYNWSSNFSQVIQGTFLRQGGYVDNYVLLQIHGGADVRGGYTNAKLFKVDSDYFLSEDCYFPINDNLTLDVRGEDISIYNRETGNDEFLDYDRVFELTKERSFIGEQYIS